MAKRRNKNKKEKINAQALRDLNTISWTPSSKTRRSEADVNSQFETGNRPPKNRLGIKNTVEESVKNIDNDFIRKDIKKSLILVSLVLALEIMLYLIWNKYW